MGRSPRRLPSTGAAKARVGRDGPANGTHPLLALQQAAGNAATCAVLSRRAQGRTLARIANDPVAIRDKWVEVIRLFTDQGKLGGQTVDYDLLRDRTIANRYFNDVEWAPMVMGVTQQLEAQGPGVPAGAFMTIMLRQLDTKHRPSRTPGQVAHYKQSAKPVKGPSRARKDALKAGWKDPAASPAPDFGTMTDPEVAYMVRQFDKAPVSARAAGIRAITGAPATAGLTRVPVACFYLWNAQGGAQRVVDDLADANTIYNRKGVHVDPLFVRQLTRADVEGAVGHKVDDDFYLDFRGVDEGGDDHHGHGHPATPRYKDKDTRKLIERYIPRTMIGALWVGDMVADAGRSPGKSNDAREKWVAVNTAYTRNRAIFPHELGHLVFASAHPVAGAEDRPGHVFADEALGPSVDEMSIALRHNVLTSGGKLDQLWPLASPTPADIFVSPGQAQRAHGSALGYHT